jgi:hypothetical protein
MNLPWTINIHLILKNEGQEGKNKTFLGVGTSGKRMGTRKGGMRVNMVDVFCIHI